MKLGRRLLVPCVALLAASARAEDSGWPAVESLPAIASANAGKLGLVARRGSPPVHGLGWSSDGRYLGLLSSHGLSVYRVEAEKGGRLTRGRTIAGADRVLGFGFSRAEETVLTCDGGPEMPLWDIRSGWRRGGVKDAGAGITSVAVSPHASLVAAVASDGRLLVWPEGSYDRPPRSFSDFDAGAAGLSIDREGKRAVTWRYGEVHVWDLAAGERILELTTRVETKTSFSMSVVRTAVMAPGGSTLLAGSYGTTFRWSLPGGEPLPRFQGGSASLTPGSFHPEGKVFLAPGKEGLGILSIADGKALRALAGVPAEALAEFEPTKGKVVAAAQAETLTLHDASTGAILRSEKLGRPSRVIAASPAGDWLLCGGESGEQELLDLRAGIQSRKISMPAGGSLLEAALGPKGTLLAMLTRSRQRDGTEAAVWKAEGARWKRLALLDKDRDSMRSVAFSHDGRWLALGTQSGDPSVKVYATGSWKVLATARVPVGAALNPVMILDVAFVPGTKLVAVAPTEHPAVVFIDFEKAAVAFELRFPSGFNLTPSGICIDTSGSLLGVPGWESLLVFDVGRRRLKQRFETEVQIDRVDFDRARALVACTSRAGSGARDQADVWVFDLASGARLCRLPAHANRTNALHFIGGGKALLSSTFDGSIGIWGVDGKERKESGEEAEPGDKESTR
jgi:WD40 repeat protein